MRLVLLALLPLAAAPALAQQAPDAASGPVGGTAVIALGSAGATIDTGVDAATGQGTASGTAAATDSSAAAAAGATAAAATGAASATSATSSTAAAGTATAGVTAATGATSATGATPATVATGATGAGSASSSDSASAATGTDSAAAAASPSGASPSTASASLPLEFRTMIGDKPIEITGDKATPAFEQFRQTGTNPFHGDEAALAEGKKLYAKLCQACHMPDGSGRIGPSLTDDLWRNPRLETEAGRFEIIHSGGAGAMQAFHPRMSTDEILKVMAYIDTFRG